MKLVWPATKGLMVRALALLPVSRRLLVIPLVTSLGFIKLQFLLQPFREAENDVHRSQESSPLEEVNSRGAESSQEDDEGLYIPSYLEEAIPDNPVLQVKMAHAMQAQEKETRRCYMCNKPGHLQKDHEKNGKGLLQPKGPPQNKSALERVITKPS